MSDNEERELRRRFSELRTVEREHAPSFTATLDRHRAATPRRARPARIAIAATFVVASVATLLFVRGRRELVPVSEIVTWRAPSDVLLTMAAPSMLGPLTPLGASVLDAIAR